MARSRLATKVNLPLAAFVILTTLLFAALRAGAQEGFESLLSRDPRVVLPNIQELSCSSTYNRQPHDPDTMLYEYCTVLFKDGSSPFQATIIFCSNFETCDRAGGRFKDMLVRVLQQKSRILTSMR